MCKLSFDGLVLGLGRRCGYDTWFMLFLVNALMSQANSHMRSAYCCRPTVVNKNIRGSIVECCGLTRRNIPVFFRTDCRVDETVSAAGFSLFVAAGKVEGVLLISISRGVDDRTKQALMPPLCGQAWHFTLPFVVVHRHCR